MLDRDTWAEIGRMIDSGATPGYISVGGDPRDGGGGDGSADLREICRREDPELGRLHAEIRAVWSAAHDREHGAAMTGDLTALSAEWRTPEEIARCAELHGAADLRFAEYVAQQVRAARHDPGTRPETGSEYQS